MRCKFPLLDFKTYHNAAVTKKCGIDERDKQVNWTEKSPKTDPHKYGLFDLTKVQRQFEEIGIVFSTHGIGIIGYLWLVEF